MLLTPSDLEGTKGVIFDKSDTFRVLFQDGSEVLMEPGKPPRCISGKKNNGKKADLAKEWLEKKLL
jgi:hypothetical protein